VAPEGRRLVSAGLWRWRRRAGLERFALFQDGSGWSLAGTLLTLDERGPIEARYRVDCDERWRTTRVAVQLDEPGRQRSLELRVDPASGRWSEGDREHEAVRGCVDADLNWSPSTNTLPIRRLQPGVGAGSGPVTAAWVRFPDLTLEPLPQEYLRLAERRYRYTSAGGAFTAELAVDEHGLVVDYGDIWERVRDGS
jgi:uncharacterized protein